MAEPKQILVIDDHFEMLEFLRSMLELSNQDYRVLGVPSAEEGLFELRRTSFDLVISDVRLPGMSGFDLVRQVQKLDRNLPVIIITAYATAQGRQEAEALGVVRYFEKPLDTDALLATIHATLYGAEGPPLAVDEALADTAVTAGDSGQQADGRPVRKRLQTLLTDTGAVQVLVADRQGTIVAQVGEKRSLDLEQLARLVAKNLDNSFLLGEQLQSREPFAIQYQTGESVDLYFANIERDHFIMLLFDVQERRGRIGTVWIFTQRAIKDLKSLLPVGAGDGAPADSPAQELETRPDAEATSMTDDTPEVEPVAADLIPEAPATESPPKAPEKAATPETEPTETDEEDGDAGTTSPADDPALQTALDDVPLQEELDLDAFWEEAASDVEQSAEGLSFEEALRRGLLPPEFGKGE